ncbi:FG-GAP repeat protein [Marispirochaeta sp.]|uniref:FG-GAP repeat protein n=1 Tax=Marispirochaeta sp. TaxID=2038653 RepID=UPI0029C857DD|nr:FG-GAP repeat protein [Marispirochaeta sp.]
MKTYKRILFVLGGLIVMLAGCSDPTGDSGTDTTDTVTPLSQLWASDAAGDDWFGNSVSLSADGMLALVGAHGDDNTNGLDSGAAYIYARNGSSWTQMAKLIPADGLAYDKFGMAVCLSPDGSTAIVGSPNNDSSGSCAGAAYIFTGSGSTWTQAVKLSASTSSDGSQVNDNFGVSVSLSSDGSVALVGALGDDTLQTANVGSVYIYSGIAWSNEVWIPSPYVDHVKFGETVCLSSDGMTALIGAPSIYSAQGRVFFYSYNASTGWTVKSQFGTGLSSPYDSNNGDRFGSSLALSSDGSVALIGAEGKGAAYVYSESMGNKWGGFVDIGSLGGGSGFGCSVSLSSGGSIALVGAQSDQQNGAAYLFTGVFDSTDFLQPSTWTQKARIAAADGASADCFGKSVSLSETGTTAIIGTYQNDVDDTEGADSGSVYSYGISY